MTAVILIVLLAVATVAGALSSRQEQAAAPQTRGQWARTVAYWVFTLLVAFELAAGGLWDLLQIDYVRVVLTHLGYPLYLLYIIGIPRIPCAFVLLLPRFSRLKEWAYAGAFFNYMGAAASHLLARDSASLWVGPLLFSIFTIASWALRPSARRLPNPEQAIEFRPITWAVPVLIVLGVLVFACLTLPKGAPQHF
jgi:DoxX-like protein